MSTVIEADGKEYLVHDEVADFLTWYRIPEEHLVRLVSIILWRDVHTEVVDTLANTNVSNDPDTPYLLHAIAREINQEIGDS